MGANRPRTSPPPTLQPAVRNTTTTVHPPPLLVGVISTAHGLKKLQEPKLPCHIVELRLDLLFHNATSLQKIEHALQQKKTPAILTARSQAEGGKYNWQRGQRQAMLQLLLPLAEGVDIEFRSLRQLQALRNSFPHTALILSAHFFQNTPSHRVLSALIQRMAAHQPNYIKIACFCRNTSALGQLAILQHKYQQLPLALMAMGPMGEFSRTLLPKLGSRLVYGWLDKPTVSGQPSVQILCQQIYSGSLPQYRAFPYQRS